MGRPIGPETLKVCKEFPRNEHGELKSDEMVLTVEAPALVSLKVSSTALVHAARRGELDLFLLDGSIYFRRAQVIEWATFENHKARRHNMGRRKA